MRLKAVSQAGELVVASCLVLILKLSLNGLFLLSSETRFKTGIDLNIDHVPENDLRLDSSSEFS